MASTVITALLLAGALHSYAVLTKTCIPYDDEDISIDEADGKLYAVYQDENLGGTVSLAPSAVTINGTEKSIVVFYYYETPWSKYIQPIFEEDDFKYTFCLGDKEEIDQIYYGEFELDDPRVDYTVIAENSELIWNKR